MCGARNRSFAIALFLIAYAMGYHDPKAAARDGEMAAAAGVNRLAGGTSRVKFDASVFGSATRIRSIVGELKNDLECELPIDAVVVELALSNDAVADLDPRCRVSFEGITFGSSAEPQEPNSVRIDAGVRSVALSPRLTPGESCAYTIRGIEVIGPCDNVELRIVPLVSERPAGTSGNAVALGRFGLRLDRATADSETSLHGFDRFAAVIDNGESIRPIRALRGAILARDGRIATVLSVSLWSMGESRSAITATSHHDANGFELRDLALAPGSECELVVVFQDKAESDGVLRLQVHAEFD